MPHIPSLKLDIFDTMWKVFKYAVFSGKYFPVFVPEKTPYLDTFQAVLAMHVDFEVEPYMSVFASYQLMRWCDYRVLYCGSSKTIEK